MHVSPLSGPYRMLLLCGLLVAGILVASCGLPWNAPPPAPSTDGLSPVPIESLRPVTLVGTIREIQTGTRALTLTEPVDGITEVRVVDETGIHQVGEPSRQFTDLRTGMRMEVTGLARPDGILLAKDLLIIGMEATAGPNTLPALDTLEQSISRYFGAVGRREPAVARQFLTPELSARMSDADLSAGPEVQSLNVVFLQTSMITTSRVQFTVGLVPRLSGDSSGEWQAGQNNRYVEFLPSPQGWRISRISTTPFS